MLPVPRFTPTVRKFRPQPIDLKEGLKKVKVCAPRLAAECRACILPGSWTCLPVSLPEVLLTDVPRDFLAVIA